MQLGDGIRGGRSVRAIKNFSGVVENGAQPETAWVLRTRLHERAGQSRECITLEPSGKLVSENLA
jgi:hypothetical protein